MKLSYLFICSVMLLLLQTSCKDDANKSEDATTIEAATTSEENNGKEEEPSKEVMANSVLAKLMVTPEAQTFTRKTINANLTDFLSKEEGPFTLLVPSNEAFDGLSTLKQESLANPAKLEELSTLLKNHIVDGEYSSATLTQSVKRNGTHTLKTLGGADLMVYLDGTNIMVKDKFGVAASIGKSDILAKNGTVHIIDSVLTAN